MEHFEKLGWGVLALLVGSILFYTLFDYIFTYFITRRHDRSDVSRVGIPLIFR